MFATKTRTILSTTRPIRLRSIWLRTMSSQSRDKIHFGPFEVTSQVFLRTPHCFALVNIKPLLPGHVLVCPLKPHKRLTDLSVPEVTDLFTTTQRVQRMLAHHYFDASEAPESITAAKNDTAAVPPEAGSFNIALQDGAQAGQTVPHVHVHILPRIPGATSKDPGPSDAIYELMAQEEGNVGGAQWDAARKEMLSDDASRPTAGGAFPRIEDADRKPRSMDEMVAEAEMFKKVLEDLGES